MIFYIAVFNEFIGTRSGRQFDQSGNRRTANSSFIRPMQEPILTRL